MLPDARMLHACPPACATVTEIRAGDAAPQDWLGWDLSVSGDTLIVGAHGDDDHGTSSGSAYVIVRTGAGWLQQAKLHSSDQAPEDGFGFAVSVSGDTAIVGADMDDDAGRFSGSAYVFVRSGSAWTEQAKLTASDAEANDHFGISVRVQGDTAVIGAHHDDSVNPSVGSVHVFVRSGSSWIERQELAPAGPRDFFGGTRAVSLDGDTLVVGAPGDDDAGLDAGAAYVFVLRGGTWLQQAKLTASDATPGSGFGGSTSLAGDSVLIGAAGARSGDAAGAAYVFLRTGDAWTEQATLGACEPANHDQFGRSVALGPTTAVVGAPFENGTGSVHLFVRDASGWTETATLESPSLREWDWFGESVAMDDEVVAVGALYHDGVAEDAGAAFVFDAGDADGDGVGDACDCAPADATNAPPPPVIDLHVARPCRLAWTASIAQDAFDVHSGTIEALWSDRGTIRAGCLASRLASPDLDDLRPSVPGLPRTGFYYLVASRNGCGRALAPDSLGAPRPIAPCP